MNVDDWAFMLFGFAFFIFVIRMVRSDQKEDQSTRIMEAREFGFGGKGQHNAKTLHKPN